MSALHVVGRAERNLLQLLLAAEADGRETFLAHAYRGRFAVVSRYADNGLVGRRDGATAAGTVQLLKREALIEVSDERTVLSAYSWQRAGDSYRGFRVTITGAGRALLPGPVEKPEPKRCGRQTAPGEFCDEPQASPGFQCDYHLWQDARADWQASL